MESPPAVEHPQSESSQENRHRRRLQALTGERSEYRDRCPKAVASLVKVEEKLLTFHDFPAALFLLLVPRS